ncbi:MAG: DUF3592 domain-containing protein [Gammaproteobacteria bacterium]|nr:DUF3592 domain-containing protein [Gammaproteobacteria bacterium]
METVSNETRKKRVTRIVLMIPTLFFLTIALYGIATDYHHIQFEKQRLAARTEVTDGTIIEFHDAWRVHSDIRTPKATVTFVTTSGQQMQFVMLRRSADQIGTKIRVHYDPQDPNDYAIGDAFFNFSDLVYDNAFYLVMGVFFLFMLFLV